MHDKVRLSKKYTKAIIEAFEGNFAAADHLWIFGSIVDMQAKGGDIDLYIETHETDLDKAIYNNSRMISQIWRAVGEQMKSTYRPFISAETHVKCLIRQNKSDSPFRR